MACGWNLWVCLVGVVVRRYIDILITIITFSYSTVLALFLAAASLLLLFIFKKFFRSCLCYFCAIANFAQRTFKIVQKSRSHEHGDIINYIDKNIDRTYVCRLRARESRDFHMRGTT